MFKVFNSNNQAIRKTWTEKCHRKCQKHEQTLYRGGNIYGQLTYEEMFSIVSDQENANQYHSDILINLAKILISDNTNH